MPPLFALILAAGEGTRMRSKTAKVLHPLSGTPLLSHVLEKVTPLNPRTLGVVIGRNGEEVREKFRSQSKIAFLWQKNPLGSGDAVRCCLGWIKKNARKTPTLLILCGDTPLISSETLSALLQRHAEQNNSATILSATVTNAMGYGRIVRDSQKRVRKIVEEKDATPAERKIQEINSGIYCFDARKLTDVLPLLKNENAKKEFYLTDVIEHLYRKGLRVETVQPASKSSQDLIEETLGVNDRSDLSRAEKIMQRRIAEHWMKSGVTILNPETTYVDAGVQIGSDSKLFPGTMLLGKTRVGTGCHIGPNSFIEDSEIGNGVTVRASFVYGTQVKDGVQIGPFSHIRKGTVLAKGARIGNFTEIKNSSIGQETKVSHLSYIGDASLGHEINVGAGAITCNFDGKKKHRTVIGSKSFVGSNANLIAPLQIGARAVIAAGSTVTQTVPPDSLAIERAPFVIKPGWTKKKREN
ncbi:MAG: bifunctional UDP-N-acetylglucosamine diphosphorylase/glucosamine-1-phosphate N-acetyltransferase GlmU [Elusimicrobia bacterium]|nr:bifunctional UDP-N-acetylglucosamine diphosphorylase/glucosamine-1-phosphate N-acetyltransferase GlmU [Elusimicrobiota bacterium]